MFFLLYVVGLNQNGTPAASFRITDNQESYLIKHLVIMNAN